jgi:hypothetical protein
VPVRYERDDVRRRVVISLQGAFQAADVFPVIARYHTEDTWSYGLLWDVRDLSGTPTITDLRAIMREDAASRPDAGPRGPVAVLASGAFVYGLACVYAALGRPNMTIEVFRDYHDADRWLATHTSP